MADEIFSDKNRTAEEGSLINVDDSDVIHLDLAEDEEIEVTHERLQESVWSWGQLLQATGGSLKGAKCFFHLLSFGFHADGTWYYERNEEQEQFHIAIPTSNGETELIEHCRVEMAHKTLGVMTCPSGSNSTAIEKMKCVVTSWMDTARDANSHGATFG